MISPPTGNDLFSWSGIGNMLEGNPEGMETGPDATGSIQDIAEGDHLE